MPRYTWVCHSCKQPNRAGTEICGSCGLPAVATGAEIEEAITGVKSPPRLSRKEWQATRRRDIASLPLWKKPFAYALQLVRLIGAVVVLTGIFSLSIRSLALGIAVVVTAELLFQFLKGRPYVWEER
jgi:hypothetical protein